VKENVRVYEGTQKVLLIVQYDFRDGITENGIRLQQAYVHHYRILHGEPEWKKHMEDLNTNGTLNFKTELTQTFCEGTN